MRVYTEKGRGGGAWTRRRRGKRRIRELKCSLFSSRSTNSLAYTYAAPSRQQEHWHLALAKHKYTGKRRRSHNKTLQCKKMDIFGRFSHWGSLHFRHFNHTFLMVELLLSRDIKYLPNAQVLCHRCQLQGIIGERDGRRE